MLTRTEKHTIFGALLVVALCFSGLIYFLNNLSAERFAEERQQNIAHVHSVRNGPDTASVVVYRSYGAFDIPSSLRVTQIRKSGKHSYDVTIEGPKAAVADFLMQNYGLSGE